MTTYSYSSESPADVRAGLLIVPVFQGPSPGPGVRETGLAKVYADAKHTGKRPRGNRSPLPPSCYAVGVD